MSKKAQHSMDVSDSALSLLRSAAARDQGDVPHPAHISGAALLAQLRRLERQGYLTQNPINFGWFITVQGQELLDAEHVDDMAYERLLEEREQDHYRMLDGQD